MRRTTKDAIRGIASLLGLLAVLVGIPWLLVAQVGWPLPTVVPSWEQVSRALTRGEVADWTIVKTVASLLWLAWAQFAVGALAELVALARRRPSPRPFMVGPLGRVAANAVASIAVLLATLGRPAPSVAHEPPRVELVPTAEEPGATSSPEVELPSAPGVAEHRLVTVQARDTLWDLAERHLGDGMRWRDIHRLNAGVPQPDGGALGDDGHIRPGWSLRIPSEQEHPAVAADDQVVVERGDTLWDLSDEHLGDPHRWPEIYDENAGVPQPDGRRLQDPDLIQPGWVLALPSDEADHVVDVPATVEEGDAEPELEILPATEPGTVPEADAAPSAPTPHVSVDPSVDAEPAEVEDDTETPSARYVTVAGAAIAAAGIATTLDRIRRSRRRRRRPGERIRVPSGDQARVEQHVRAVSDVEARELVDNGLRSLAHACHQAGREVPRIAVVSVTSQDVAVHLAARDDAPPEGWRVEDGGRTWVHAADFDAALVAGTPHPTPMLVTVGSAASGLRRVMLNLAHVRRLALDVPEDMRRRILLHLAVELATSSAADALQVLVHGFGGRLTPFERVDFCPELSELLEELVGLSDADGGGEVLGVGLCVDADVEVPVEVRDAPNVAVVSGPSPGTPFVIREVDGALRLLPVGLELRPLELDPADLEEAGELVLEAKSPPRPVDAPSVDVSTNGSSSNGTAPAVIDLADEESSEEPRVEVRVLGPVEVAGAEDLKSAKAEELIVHLAMHPHGATIDELQEVLWPEESPSPGRLHTTAWRARQALGVGSDGEPLLPKVAKGRYRLSPEVGLDYASFRGHVARAESTPELAVGELRAALELVRGEPFSATSTEYVWASLDVHALAQEVGDAAHQLATLYLQEGRPADARWAAEQGLRADPYLEALYRDLMKAASAEGNTAEVEVIMGRLRKLVADDAVANDADDRLDPETLRTYSACSRGSAVVATD